MPVSISLVDSISMTQQGTVKLELVSEGVNMSGKVFVIEVLPSSADPENPECQFSHVCSPMELYEIPEDEPGDGIYFRTDRISMVFDVVKIAEQALDTIRCKVEHLVMELNALEAVGESINSIAVPDVLAILSAPPEFQFSQDNENWHDEQDDMDEYVRMRNSALHGDWSIGIKMPVRQ